MTKRTVWEIVSVFLSIFLIPSVVQENNNSGEIIIQEFVENF